ncbi:MAG: helix-turn-helix transcriptional regulator [Actinobacteria bacterium]|nr:helix-turn-helix transcriptional regulator [Actinomycetota bacterium]
MGIVMNVAEATSLLRGARRGPQGAARFRHALVTCHTMARGESLRWSPQSPESPSMAAMIVAKSPLRVSDGGSAAQDLPAGRVAFLHPARATRITASRESAMICVWVSWSVLDDAEQSGEIPAGPLPDSPLARGLAAFLESVVERAADVGSHTDAVIERLIGEMLFGVLADAASHGSVRPRTPRIVDRARDRILARHVDPEFDVTALAREMHLGSRQLQRHFAAEDSTAADELRRMRVRVARDLIEADGAQAMALGEIAQRSGFRDRAALRRAFAASGMPAPRRMRPSPR